MKIKSLNIKNFKSIVDITINEPNPFTVFVGPNGSGKSNIFEALEFANLMTFENDIDKKLEIEKSFGDSESFLNRNFSLEEIFVGYEFKDEVIAFYWSLKNKAIIDLINQGKNQIIKHQGLFAQILKDNEPDSIDFSKLSTSILTERFDKILSSKIDSFSFTIPIESSSMNSNNSELLDEYLLANFFSNAKKIIDKGSFDQFFNEFSRIFLNSRIKDRSNFKRYLKNDGSNLEKAISFLLKNEVKREELLDWLRLFIPEFEDIEYSKNQINGKNSLQIFEKKSNIPFNTSLISDGTFNILAILTAVLQSDDPQFLCIEEPENGLHPKVVKELVNLFRDACEQYGHYIWINTHSQTLVSKLEPHEVILVDKVEGETRIKQLKDFNLHGFEMDEAWLSNALGGGIPW